MRATGYSVNKLEVYQRKPGKETVKKSPPVVRTNLNKWAQGFGSEQVAFYAQKLIENSQPAINGD